MERYDFNSKQLHVTAVSIVIYTGRTVLFILRPPPPSLTPEPGATMVIKNILLSGTDTKQVSLKAP